MYRPEPVQYRYTDYTQDEINLSILRGLLQRRTMLYQLQQHWQAEIKRLSTGEHFDRDYYLSSAHKALSITTGELYETERLIELYD